MPSSLDTRMIRDHIVQGSIAAVNQTLLKTEVRAKKYAPVRKLFRGTTYEKRVIGGKEYRLPKLSRFRAVEDRAGPTARKIRVQGNRTPREFEADALPTNVERLGHANSLQPIFRFRTGRVTTLLEGDFRVIRKGGGLAQVQPKLARLRAGAIKPLPDIPPISATGVRNQRGQGVLTARGRFEVQSGRANFRTGARQPFRIGGRLRGEIHIEKATQVGRHVWGYVVSPTKYARPQEFGSRHNRPHPYMRPALHESRGDLKAAVKRNVQAGSQT